MNARISLALAIVIAVLSARSRAAIISQNWHTPGDGLLTYDTINHREWLDLSQTDGLPLATVEQSLEPGGSLYGFHRATVADVSEFVTSSGYIGLDAYSPQDFAIANELNDLLGQDFSYTTDSTFDHSPYDRTFPTPDKIELVARFTNGVVGDEVNPGVLNPYTISTVLSGSYTGDVFFLYSQVSEIGIGFDPDGSLTQATVGASWLYRDVPIPEPSSQLLFLLAGFTISTFCRRRYE